MLSAWERVHREAPPTGRKYFFFSFFHLSSIGNRKKFLVEAFRISPLKLLQPIPAAYLKCLVYNFQIILLELKFLFTFPFKIYSLSHGIDEAEVRLHGKKVRIFFTLVRPTEKKRTATM